MITKYLSIGLSSIILVVSSLYYIEKNKNDELLKELVLVNANNDILTISINELSDSVDLYLKRAKTLNDELLYRQDIINELSKKDIIKVKTKVVISKINNNKINNCEDGLTLLKNKEFLKEAKKW